MKKSKQKSSDLPVLMSRIRMIGEDLLPFPEIEKLNLPKGAFHIFMTVANPDDWPETMKPLRDWIEENVPPEYWAEFEEE